MMQETKMSNARPDVLVVLTVLLIIFFALALVAFKVPDGIVALFSGLLGSLLKSYSSMIDFEFGSSRGSKEKDAALLNDPQPPATGR